MPDIHQLYNFHPPPMNVLKKGYMHQQWFESIIRAFLFVRGHTSIKGNEKPDGLAVSGAIGEGPSRD